LRAADKVVNDALTKHDLLRSLAQARSRPHAARSRRALTPRPDATRSRSPLPATQVPVTLFPVGFGLPGGRSVGIRAFLTRDFMTGTPALPGKDLPFAAMTEIVDGILSIGGIARVAFDISPKPPATTEWE
jgi:GMP synthase PP-ATPase subunit